MNRAEPSERKIGPSRMPRNPKERRPPNTPRNTSAIGSGVPCEISMGFRKLSTLDTANVPQSARKMAYPISPFR